MGHTDIPPGQFPQGVVIGHVAFDGRDGNIPVTQCGPVNIRLVVGLLAVAPLPVVDPVTRIPSFFKVLGKSPGSLTAPADTANLGRSADREN